MYRPPHKRPLALTSPGELPGDASPHTSSGPVIHSQRLTLATSPMAQESMAKYQPPHKRAVPTATQRQRSLHLPPCSAPPTEHGRTTGASRPRHRLFDGSQNILQSSEARAVINAAAAANSTGSRAVPAPGAVPSSKVAAVQLNGRSTQAQLNALHSHSNGAMGHPDFVADTHTRPSLVELLTSADTDVRLDTASGVTSNLPKVNTCSGQHLKAKQLASRQQKADTNGQQKESANGPQKAAPEVEGQPKAKVDAILERQLEVGGSPAQRLMANELHPRFHGHSEVDGRTSIEIVSEAQKNPWPTAKHSTGMLVSTHKHSCLAQP